MSRARIKEATVRELVHWWREQGWTPASAHALTRYWPDGAFGAADHMCAYEGCQAEFPHNPAHPHKRFCSERCQKLQGRHIAQIAA